MNETDRVTYLDHLTGALNTGGVKFRDPFEVLWELAAILDDSGPQKTLVVTQISSNKLEALKADLKRRGRTDYIVRVASRVIGLAVAMVVTYCSWVFIPWTRNFRYYSLPIGLAVGYAVKCQIRCWFRPTLTPENKAVQQTLYKGFTTILLRAREDMSAALTKMEESISSSDYNMYLMLPKAAGNRHDHNEFEEQDREGAELQHIKAQLQVAQAALNVATRQLHRKIVDLGVEDLSDNSDTPSPVLLDGPDPDDSVRPKKACKIKPLIPNCAKAWDRHIRLARQLAPRVDTLRKRLPVLREYFETYGLGRIMTKAMKYSKTDAAVSPSPLVKLETEIGQVSARLCRILDEASCEERDFYIPLKRLQVRSPNAHIL